MSAGTASVAPKRGSVSPATVGLIGLRIALVLVAIRASELGRISDDLRRFSEIANAAGTPYRSLSVEYAPIEVAIIRIIGVGAISAVAARVAILACICDVATWITLRFGWGRSSATAYLILGTPLLLFLYTRLDLLPVALATMGAALATRGRERGGGIGLASAVMTKLWPLVVFPALWIERKRRALWWGVGSMIGAGICWLAVGGIQGITQVVSFRGANGWEVESTVGSVVWAVTGGPVQLEAGAPRVGTVTIGAKLVLAALLLIALTMVWRRARSWRGSAFGSPSVVAVAALLACAPVFSLQYAAWLLPWGAVAWADGDRRTVRLLAAAEVLTGLLFVIYSPQRVAASEVLVLLRNALVIAIPIGWLIHARGLAGEQGAGDEQRTSTAAAFNP